MVIGAPGFKSVSRRGEKEGRNKKERGRKKNAPLAVGEEGGGKGRKGRRDG